MAPPSIGPGGTRPENLGASRKRAKGPSVYSHLLPIVPASARVSFLAPFLSALPFLALSPPQVNAVYDTLTRAITVSDEHEMLLLWRRGFIGKGSLSRSEPAWKKRVQNMRAPLEGRQKRMTAEEATAQRRVDRIATKLTKKAEREAERLAAATAAAADRVPSPADLGGGVPSTSSSLLAEDADVDSDVHGDDKPARDLATKTDLETLSKEAEADADAAAEADADADAAAEADADADADAVGEDKEPPPPAWQLDAETTQLQPEEAFFLLLALGCLSLRTADPWRQPESPPSPQLSIRNAWRLFLLDAAPAPTPTPDTCEVDVRLARWDSPFLVSYAVYHHYRSMGWVVRSGIKFCTDWVLYGPGGPVGSHAEFAVVVIPSYADAADATSCPFHSDRGSGQALAEGETRGSWKWFHTVNRVCSGVKKTLVLVHVLIPPLSTLPSPEWIEENPAKALARFEIREVAVRRWLPGRTRD